MRQSYDIDSTREFSGTNNNNNNSDHNNTITTNLLMELKNSSSSSSSEKEETGGEKRLVAIEEAEVVLVVEEEAGEVWVSTNKKPQARENDFFDPSPSHSRRELKGFEEHKQQVRMQHENGASAKRKSAASGADSSARKSRQARNEMKRAKLQQQQQQDSNASNKELDPNQDHDILKRKQLDTAVESGQQMLAMLNTSEISLPTSSQLSETSSSSSSTSSSSSSSSAGSLESNSNPNSNGNENICAACLKPIKERYLLMALDKQWHEDCLKCACCDCRLGEVGSSLFTHSDKILCKRDFLRIFGQHGHCAACKKSIPPYELVMRANQNAYHMDCFACQQCQYRFCVGDRFHLTEVHRIVCILCHSEQQQQQQTNIATNNHHHHHHHHQPFHHHPRSAISTSLPAEAGGPIEPPPAPPNVAIDLYGQQRQYFTGSPPPVRTNTAASAPTPSSCPLDEPAQATTDAAATSGPPNPNFLFVGDSGDPSRLKQSQQQQQQHHQHQKAAACAM